MNETSRHNDLEQALSSVRIFATDNGFSGPQVEAIFEMGAAAYQILARRKEALHAIQPQALPERRADSFR